MAKPKRRDGLASPEDKTDKKIKKQKKEIGVKELVIIGIGINIIIAIASCFYANINGEIGAWFTFQGDMFSGVAAAIFAGEGGITCLVCLHGDQKGKHFCVVMFFITIFLFQVGVCFKIAGEVNATPTSILVEDNSIIKNPELQPQQYEKRQYIFEEDPFLENLELYFGVEKGTILKEDRVTKMAEIIRNDILVEQRKSEKNAQREMTQDYEKFVAIAEKQYDTYLYQRNRDSGNTENYITELEEERFKDLQIAIEKRQEADQECEIGENRRIIALYYKDAGDDCKKKALRYEREGNDFSEEEKEAQEYYENGAIWCMKAIYSFMKENDLQKAKKVLELFEAIDKETENEQIKELLLVYTEIVQ